MPTPRLLLTLLVAALLLGGCSIGEDEPTSSKPRPLKVQHARDETRVPFTAERPVTLDPAALEAALALGVTPVGSASWLPEGRFPAYLGARVEGVERLGVASDPDVAAIAPLDPDVIIGNELFQKRLYTRLDEIAPTVYSGVPLSEWKADLRFFGEALGRSDQGERLLIDWDRRAARTREALGEDPPARFRLPADLRRSLDQGFVDSVLEDAGLPPGSTTASGRGGGILAGRALLDALERQAAR